MFRRRPSKVDISLRVDAEDGETDSLIAELVVNDQCLSAFEHGPLDLCELERSLTEEGNFFIWTCTCGEPGCGGRHKGVAVSHIEERVRWKDIDMRQNYSFLTQDLKAALERTRTAGGKMVASEVVVDVVPPGNRDLFITTGEQFDALNPGSFLCQNDSL